MPATIDEALAQGVAIIKRRSDGCSIAGR